MNLPKPLPAAVDASDVYFYHFQGMPATGAGKMVLLKWADCHAHAFLLPL